NVGYGILPASHAASNRYLRLRERSRDEFDQIEGEGPRCAEPEPSGSAFDRFQTGANGGGEAFAEPFRLLDLTIVECRFERDQVGHPQFLVQLNRGLQANTWHREQLD